MRRIIIHAIKVYDSETFLRRHQRVKVMVAGEWVSCYALEQSDTHVLVQYPGGSCGWRERQEVEG